MNSTFDKGPVRRLDSTFAKDSSPALNSTFEIAADIRQDLDRHHNGTFNTKPTTSASLLHQQHNATFDISNNATFEVIRNHSQDNDDRLSSTSDSSVSHRLNDLGDVQHLESTVIPLTKVTVVERQESPKGQNETLHIDPLADVKCESAADIRQDLDRHHNGTFNTKPTTSASLLHQQHNATFDISNNATFEVIRNHSQDNDDRLSSTSDSSVSHRLNDLGDVQHLARMQEESKFLFTIF